MADRASVVKLAWALSLTAVALTVAFLILAGSASADGPPPNAAEKDLVQGQSLQGTLFRVAAGDLHVVGPDKEVAATTSWTERAGFPVAYYASTNPTATTYVRFSVYIAANPQSCPEQAQSDLGISMMLRNAGQFFLDEDGNEIVGDYPLNRHTNRANDPTGSTMHQETESGITWTYYEFGTTLGLRIKPAATGTPHNDQLIGGNPLNFRITALCSGVQDSHDTNKAYRFYLDNTPPTLTVDATGPGFNGQVAKIGDTLLVKVSSGSDNSVAAIGDPIGFIDLRPIGGEDATPLLRGDNTWNVKATGTGLNNPATGQGVPITLSDRYGNTQTANLTIYADAVPPRTPYDGVATSDGTTGAITLSWKDASLSEVVRYNVTWREANDPAGAWGNSLTLNVTQNGCPNGGGHSLAGCAVTLTRDAHNLIEGGHYTFRILGYDAIGNPSHAYVSGNPTTVGPLEVGGAVSDTVPPVVVLTPPDAAARAAKNASGSVENVFVYDRLSGKIRGTSVETGSGVSIVEVRLQRVTQPGREPAGTLSGVHCWSTDPSAPWPLCSAHPTGGWVSATVSGTSWQLDSVPTGAFLFDGHYQVKVRAVDAVGLPSEETPWQTLWVDRGAPALASGAKVYGYSLLCSSVACIPSSQVELRQGVDLIRLEVRAATTQGPAKVSDPLGLSSITVRFHRSDGTNVPSTTAPGDVAWSYTQAFTRAVEANLDRGFIEVDTSGLPLGNYTHMTVVVTDLAGNTLSLSTDNVIDLATLAKKVENDRHGYSIGARLALAESAPGVPAIGYNATTGALDLTVLAGYSNASAVDGRVSTPEAGTYTVATDTVRVWYRASPDGTGPWLPLGGGDHSTPAPGVPQDGTYRHLVSATVPGLDVGNLSLKVSARVLRGDQLIERTVIYTLRDAVSTTLHVPKVTLQQPAEGALSANGTWQGAATVAFPEGSPWDAPITSLRYLLHRVDTGATGFNLSAFQADPLAAPLIPWTPLDPSTGDRSVLLTATGNDRLSWSGWFNQSTSRLPNGLYVVEIAAYSGGRQVPGTAIAAPLAVEDRAPVVVLDPTGAGSTLYPAGETTHAGRTITVPVIVDARFADLADPLLPLRLARSGVDYEGDATNLTLVSHTRGPAGPDSLGAHVLLLRLRVPDAIADGQTFELHGRATSTGGLVTSIPTTLLTLDGSTPTVATVPGAQGTNASLRMPTPTLVLDVADAGTGIHEYTIFLLRSTPGASEHWTSTQGWTAGAPLAAAHAGPVANGQLTLASLAAAFDVAEFQGGFSAYTVRVVLEDRVGNRLTRDLLVSVDLDLPGIQNAALTWTSGGNPANTLSTLEGVTFELDATDDYGLSAADLLLEGPDGAVATYPATLVTGAATTHHVVFNLTGTEALWLPGTYTVTFRVTDRIGNSVTAPGPSLTVVDDVPPIVRSVAFHRTGTDHTYGDNVVDTAAPWEARVVIAENTGLDLPELKAWVTLVVNGAQGTRHGPYPLRAVPGATDPSNGSGAYRVAFDEGTAPPPFGVNETWVLRVAVKDVSPLNLTHESDVTTFTLVPNLRPLVALVNPSASGQGPVHVPGTFYARWEVVDTNLLQDGVTLQVAYGSGPLVDETANATILVTPEGVLVDWMRTGQAHGTQIRAVLVARDAFLAVNEPSETTFLVDASGPVASAVVGTPQVERDGGLLLVSPRTNVTLLAVDADPSSGDLALFYSVNGGAFQPYQGPFVYPGTGSVTLHYYAVDRLGNQGPTGTLNLTMDEHVPSLELVTLGDEGDRTVRFNVTDGDSGIDADNVTLQVRAIGSTQYVAVFLERTGSTAFSGTLPNTLGGTVCYRITARDRVGNLLDTDADWVQPKPPCVTLPNRAPTLHVGLPAGLEPYRGDVTFPWSVTDPDGGPYTVTMELMRPDGAPLKTFTGIPGPNFTLASGNLSDDGRPLNGTYVLVFKVTDTHGATDSVTYQVTFANDPITVTAVPGTEVPAIVPPGSRIGIVFRVSTPAPTLEVERVEAFITHNGTTRSVPLMSAIGSNVYSFDYEPQRPGEYTVDIAVKLLGQDEPEVFPAYGRFEVRAGHVVDPGDDNKHDPAGNHARPLTWADVPRSLFLLAGLVGATVLLAAYAVFVRWGK